MKIRLNQVWIAKGKKAKWTVWNINSINGYISLTRNDILNPGYGGDRYEKHIAPEDLIKNYKLNGDKK